MNRTPISHGILSTLLTVWLSFVASTVHAAEDTIKVGILHSLSGTMAISEAVRALAGLRRFDRSRC